jgi:hypothetical protein
MEDQMTTHQECYGHLYRTELTHGNAQETVGAVFHRNASQAGMATLSPRIDVDLDAWDACRECPEFSGCLQLSASKLLIELYARH